MSDKVIKFPITRHQRRKNQLGPLALQCDISGRVMRFHKSSNPTSNGEYFYMEIFPEPDSDNPDKKQHRICEFVFNKEDLLSILNQISPDSSN